MAEAIGALTLHAAAARYGAYRWVEQRLFEVTGAWAAGPGVSPAVSVHLFEASAQHGWHAELWAERLPVVPGIDPEALTRPAGPGLEALFDALAPPEARGLGERAGERRLLAGLYRAVLPRLLVSYRRHVQELTPVADGPAARAISFVLRDEEREMLEGESLLQGAIRTHDDMRATAEVQCTLESLLLEDEVREGLFPWSDPDFRIEQESPA